MSLAGGGLNGEKGWFLGGVRTARRKERQETCDSKLSFQAQSAVYTLYMVERRKENKGSRIIALINLLYYSTNLLSDYCTSSPH